MRRVFKISLASAVSAALLSAVLVPMTADAQVRPQQQRGGSDRGQNAAGTPAPPRQRAPRIAPLRRRPGIPRHATIGANDLNQRH